MTATADGTTRKGRASALVLMEKVWLPEPAALVEVLRTRFEGLGEVALDLDARDHGLLALAVDGVTVAIERRAQPMEDTPLAAPVQPERSWDPELVVKHHTAHLRVACAVPASGGDPEALRAANRRAAGLVAVIAGVLARLAKAGAVYYPVSRALLTDDEALRAAGAAVRGVAPIEAWVSFYLVGPGVAARHGDGRGSAEGRSEGRSAPDLGRPSAPIGGYTDGLEPFVGREIELAPLALTPLQARDRLYGAVWQALDGEEALHDGFCFRAPDDSIVSTVRSARQWLREGVPAFVLVGPEAVVDLKLRLKSGVGPEVLAHPAAPAPAAETAGAAAEGTAGKAIPPHAP